MSQRLKRLDVIRGIALIFIIFFHTSVYNYANIHKIDFSNPPISVVLISFLVLWGGLLILYSGFVNTIRVSEKISKGTGFKVIKFPLIAGFSYIIIHYILNIFLGRWSNDFVNNQPDMTVVAASIRNMYLTFPNITKYFEGSSISTIALNLIIISLLLFFLLRGDGIKKQKRNYLLLGTLGSIIMIFSFIRVYVYSFLTSSIESGNHLLSIAYSFILANPYPLLPYLAYGLFASLLGLMYYNNRKDLIKKVMIPIGSFFFIYGLIGSLNFEKTISTPDLFWYFKTNLELGIFILLMVIFTIFLKEESKIVKNISFVTWFSRVSLTVYLLETFVSEILRLLLNYMIPSWNQTINGCLAFGALNVFVWVILLFLWKKHNFKYSLEYFWVASFKKLGKNSTKLENIQ